MENSPGAPQASQPATAQRSVRLRRAIIRADGDRLARTAEFTDGSTGELEMKWPEVRRVAAFRRDVLSDPVLCVAITDTEQVVVLDESMDGWQSLLKVLSRHLVASPSFSEWRSRIGDGSTESHWTVLFRSAP